MSKPHEHPIVAVHIAGKKHRVECDCGWKSKPAKSELDAKKDHDAHVKGAK